MADEQVNVTITARDEASRVLEGVSDSAGDAARDVDELDRKLDDTTRADREIVIEARADDAKRAVKDVGDELDKLEGKGHHAGAQIGESFTRDVGGVLDEERAGPIADYQAALLGLGETIGGAGGPFAKIGESIGKVAGALGLGGVAFIAVQTFFDLWSRGAQHAREESEKLQAVHEKIAAGQTADAAKALTEQFRDQITAAERLGIAGGDVIRFITGSTDALGDYVDATHLSTDAAQVYLDLQKRFPELTVAQQDALADLIPQLARARTGYQGAGDDLATLQRRQFDAIKAIGGTSDAMLDLARTAIPAVREEIVNYIALQEGIPKTVVTDILTDLDTDDAAQVRRELDELTKAREIAVSVRYDETAYHLPGGTTILGGPMTSSVVDSAARSWARRNGSG